MEPAGPTSIIQAPPVQPTLVYIAGPNGSGKSRLQTMLEQYAELPFVNADVIAKEEGLDTLAAQQQAQQRRDRMIEEGQSFVYESVFSHPNHIAAILRARTRGFWVHLIFVTSPSPDVSIARVRQRVAQGGHDVPADRIRARWEVSRGNLPGALFRASAATVVETADEVAAIAQWDGQQLVTCLQLPGTETSNGRELARAIEAFGEVLTQSAPCTLARIDADHYEGVVQVIVDTSACFIQATGAGPMLHELRHLQSPPAVRVGANIRVTYRSGIGQVELLD